MSSTGVICSGAIVFDILARPVDALEPWGTNSFVESLEYHSGGNGANTSLALARLGVPVRLLGAVGRDEQGRFLLDRLCDAGVDTAFVERSEEPTAATVALVNSSGERRILHRPGAGAHAFPEPIAFTAAMTAGIERYHLSSLFILPAFRANAARSLENARAAGLATSLDTNWDPLGRWMQDLGPCMPHVDTLFLNEDETRMVTGRSSPREAAEFLLACGVGTVVIKLGPRGCAIYTGACEILSPAFEVDALDTTGAGDCFVAGYLAALLDGATPAEAGRYGNAVAAFSVQRIGSVAGVPPRAEVDAWMRTARVRAGAAG
jgi:sugar/nucleoside kinase (ribokinase family)